METSFDNVIHQLKVLSEVKRNGRIRMSHHGKMTIETETYPYLTPIVRMLRGDSREQGLRQISSTLSEAFHHTRLMLNSKYLSKPTPVPKVKGQGGNNGGGGEGKDTGAQEISDAERDEKRRLLEKLKIVSRELKASIKGLDALRFTYADDAETVTELKVMEENIRLQLAEISQKCPELVWDDGTVVL